MYKMHKKKTTGLALAILMTLSLPLIAEEGSEAVAGGEAAEAPETPAEDVGSTGYATPPAEDPVAAMQQRLREREARYEDLKQRAREVGVMLPEDPPWKASGMGMMPDMTERMQRHQAMMSMTPEERMAVREEHYKAMQARARERGVDLPDTPPWEARQSAQDQAWEKHQAVIDGMTDEERAACQAMHQRQMGMMRRDLPGRPMMRNPGMGPGMMGPGMMGPGYGYGPNPYGPQNFWDPNQ